jgi:chromate transporter
MRQAEMSAKYFNLILSFLKLGFTAFGGPAAAYAMMRQMFVLQRKWLTEDEFFKFLGIANIIPGPNATEMAMLIGYHQLGWWGLVAAGICYILPAMVVVLVLSWVYVRFGSLPELSGILYGIKPVIVAILVFAIWGMIKPRMKKVVSLLIAVGVMVAYLLGVSPFILLLAGGILIASYRLLQDNHNHSISLFSLIPFSIHFVLLQAQEQSYYLWRLFWVFLKAGALMYGSGYVLLAFIYDDLVVRLGWLTSEQIVDAIAVGQFTPGPLATTATFIGYLLGGVPAGLLATAAMFLPSFIITIILVMVMKRLKLSERVGFLMEGVSFAALGLMAGVTWELFGASIVDPFTAVIGLIAVILLFWLNISSPWLVLGGALIGLVRVLLGR